MLPDRPCDPEQRSDSNAREKHEDDPGRDRAHGLGDNLISRAAAVTMKERRRLIIAHREMPLSPIDVNNYKILNDAGAIVAPCNPGFYLNPTTVGEVVDFVAGKLLDLIGVPHVMETRWDPKKAK